MRTAINGPCCHCGTIQTPCWRKGPIEKPVLCNACGARWLVKNDLNGYMPGKKNSSNSAVKTERAPSNTRTPRLKHLNGGVSKRASSNLKGLPVSETTLLSIYQTLGPLILKSSNIFVGSSSSYPSSPSSESSSEDINTLRKSVDHNETSSMKIETTSDDFSATSTVTVHGDNICEEASLKSSTQRSQVTNFSSEPLMHRRSRKQSRPVACSS